MKNILSPEIIEKSSYAERRLIIYLLGKEGKPGMLLRNPGEDQSDRLQSLINLVSRNVIKIVKHNSKHIYFKFTDSFENKKISVSFGCYINIK